MVETKKDEKRKIKNFKNTKGKAAVGFVNGKLYRGYNSKAKKTKYKTNKKQDYKTNKANNKQSHKTKTKNSKVNINKKALFLVLLILLSIFFIAISAYAIYKEITENKEGESGQSVEDVRNEYTGENETFRSRNLDIQYSDYDDEQGVNNTEDNTNDLNIPDPLLDDPDTESNTVNLGEIIRSENQDTIESISVYDYTEDYSNVEPERDEIVSAEEEDIYTDTHESAGARNDRSSVNGEAIFFVSKIEGDYGLVGYPLKAEVNKLELKEKIKVLAKLLINKPGKSNIITMIPEETKFLGFKLVEKTLYLNFNETFNYNSYGLETDIQQIAQIVYTFTSLKEIDKVSFMINGEYTTSIGSHGIQNKEWTEEEIAALF